MVKLKCLQSMAGATFSYTPGQCYDFESPQAEAFDDDIRFTSKGVEQTQGTPKPKKGK